jgi:hypothetical protein
MHEDIYFGTRINPQFKTAVEAVAEELAVSSSQLMRIALLDVVDQARQWLGDAAYLREFLKKSARARDLAA